MRISLAYKIIGSFNVQNYTDKKEFTKCLAIAIYAGIPLRLFIRCWEVLA